MYYKGKENDKGNFQEKVEEKVGGNIEVKSKNVKSFPSELLILIIVIIIIAGLLTIYCYDKKAPYKFGCY